MISPLFVAVVAGLTATAAAAQQPGRARAQYHLGFEAAKRGDDSSARRAFDRALAFDAADTGRAMAYADSILALTPDNRVGLRLRHQGRYRAMLARGDTVGALSEMPNAFQYGDSVALFFYRDWYYPSAKGTAAAKSAAVHSAAKRIDPNARGRVKAERGDSTWIDANGKGLAFKWSDLPALLTAPRAMKALAAVVVIVLVGLRLASGSSAERVVEVALADREELLWAGTPVHGLRLWSNLGWLIPGLGCAGSVMILAMASLGAGITWRNTGEIWVFVVLGLAWAFGAIAVDAMRRARTSYAVTSQRLLIQGGLLKDAEKSIPLARIIDVESKAEGGDVGTIKFSLSGPGVKRVVRGNTYIIPERATFELIPRAESVREIVMQARDDVRRAQKSQA